LAGTVVGILLGGGLELLLAIGGVFLSPAWSKATFGVVTGLGMLIGVLVGDRRTVRALGPAFLEAAERERSRRASAAPPRVS
jgi:hypothetical protein